MLFGATCTERGVFPIRAWTKKCDSNGTKLQMIFCCIVCQKSIGNIDSLGQLVWKGTVGKYHGHKEFMSPESYQVL